MLSEHYINGLSDLLHKRFALLDSKHGLLPGLEQKYYNDLFMANSFSSQTSSKLARAKKVFRDPALAYDPNLLQEARSTLEHATAIISMAYYPTQLGLTSFSMPLFSGSLRDLERLTQSKDINPYIALYDQYLIPFIKEQKPDIVGITIAGQSQQIPAFSLARLIKQMPEKPHVVIGGHVVTILRDVLKHRPELFNTFCDSAVLYDGEKPLLDLANALDEGRSLNDVPNLVYWNGEEIRTNDIAPPIDINSLPAPDFDGLPLGSYLSPEPVLQVLSSRGCYWSRCAFCTHGLGYGKRYQARDPKKVAEDLSQLSQKYGVRHFAFSDEGISPSAMNKLADELIAKKIKATLSTNIRLEKQFNQELCDKMAAAGFKLLYLGLESGCDRVLGPHGQRH